MIRSLPTAAATVLTVAVSAGAQPPSGNGDVAPAETGSKLAFQFAPGVWLPRLNGSAKLGPSAFADHVDFEYQFELDDMEPTLNGELLLTFGEDWQLFFSGFDFSTDNEGRFVGFSDFGSLRFFPGDRYRASFDTASYAVEGLLPIAEPVGSIIGPAAGENAALSFSALLGLRWLDVDQSVESLDFGGVEETGGEWLAGSLGMRVNLQYEPDPAWWIMKRLEIDVAAGAGPALDGSGTFWQIRGGMTAYVTEQIGFTLGYRLLEMDLSKDEYDLDGGMKGLFIAGTVRF
ncbi:MAG: hypothetical protein JSV91_09720 [Phycisphaerales bacterium]|nr:MAG: hypothetical protein JSV91_09720 [Phycisphaerales bacterium]